MTTNLFQYLGLCTDGQYESRDSLLVFMPHLCPRGTMHIIKELCKAQPVEIQPCQSVSPKLPKQQEGTVLQRWSTHL